VVTSETSAPSLSYLLFPTLAPIASGPLSFSWIDSIVSVRRDGAILSVEIKRCHGMSDRMRQRQGGCPAIKETPERYERILVVLGCIGTGDPLDCLLSVTVGEGSSSPPSDKASRWYGQKCCRILERRLLTSQDASHDHGDELSIQLQSSYLQINMTKKLYRVRYSLSRYCTDDKSQTRHGKHRIM
jgi:hypothetical protein